MMRIIFLFVLFSLSVNMLLAQENAVPQSVVEKETVLLTKYSDKDLWIAQDKLKHFVASAVLAGAGTYWAKHKQNKSESEAIILGCSISFTLGLCKEISDKKRGHIFSLKDGLADVLGIVAGVLIFGW